MPLRNHLKTHQIETAYEKGWATLSNGELLAAAEQAKFNLLITTDQNLRDQQNLAGRMIAIVVLSTTSWPRIRQALPAIRYAVDGAVAGGLHGDRGSLATANPIAR